MSRLPRIRVCLREKFPAHWSEMLAISRAIAAPARACIQAGLLCVAGAVSSLVVVGEEPASTAAIKDAEQAKLRERIREMVVGLKDVPLPAIIEALTGHRVLPWPRDSRQTLETVAHRIETMIEEREIEAARMNEAGNRVENVVIDAMRNLGIRAQRPKTESGQSRSAGYPDIEAEIDGLPCYIEVKTFSAATVDSTQRSFYLSPSTDFKVTRDAVHLLVAVELTPGAKGAYRAETVRWLDLSGLDCDLKYEFNASNRDLYRRESGLVILELQNEKPPGPAVDAPPDAAAP